MIFFTETQTENKFSIMWITNRLRKNVICSDGDVLIKHHFFAASDEHFW